MHALTTVYRIRQHTARRVKHFQKQHARHVPSMSTEETAAMARNELPALRAGMLPVLDQLQKRLSNRAAARDTEMVVHTTPAGNTWQVVLRVRNGASSMAALLTYRTTDGAMDAMHFNLTAADGTTAIAHHYPATLLTEALRLSAFDGNLHTAAGRMLLHGYARSDAGRQFPLVEDGPMCGLRERGLLAMFSPDRSMIAYYRGA